MSRSREEVGPENSAEETEFYRTLARSYTVEYRRRKARREMAIACIVAVCTACVVGILLTLVYSGSI